MREIRSANCSADLDAIHRLDIEAFGDRAYSFDKMKAIYDACSDYTTLLIESGELLGYVYLYSLKPSDFAKFRGGSMPERDMDTFTRAELKAAPAMLWYISDIVVRPDKQKTGVGMAVFRAAIRKWLTLPIAYPARLYAIAYSDGGARLMKNFGFSKVAVGKDMADGDDLYELAIDAPPRFTM
ncbi:MAG: hypothetical protein AB7G06_01480 [Bdellovibrionales bacterium]